MKKKKTPSLPPEKITPSSAVLMSSIPTEEPVLSQEDLARFNKPPITDPIELQKLREVMEKRFLDSGDVFEDEQGRIIKIPHRYINDAIRVQIREANPGIPLKAIAKPLHELIPLLKKFDWRSLQIPPRVRDQGTTCQICWAHVATAAFESSLTLRLANLRLAQVTGGQLATQRTKISLSVECTLDSVDKGLARCQTGRHDRAFDHFVNRGVPLAGLSYSTITEDIDKIRDRKLSPAESVRNLIQAVAQHYVTPLDINDEGDTIDVIPDELAMKKALLEHGPLAVMVNVDTEFGNYGKLKPGEPIPPDDKVPVFQGNTRQTNKDHLVLLIGWNDEKTPPAWIIQNSRGTDWGYSCNGPRIMPGDPRANDRGYMYIARDSNDIGAAAAWIEAPLLTDQQVRQIRAITLA